MGIDVDGRPTTKAFTPSSGRAAHVHSEHGYCAVDTDGQAGKVRVGFHGPQVRRRVCPEHLAGLRWISQTLITSQLQGLIAFAGVLSHTGILEWYDRAAGNASLCRAPTNPRFVQTDGV